MTGRRYLLHKPWKPLKNRLPPLSRGGWSGSGHQERGGSDYEFFNGIQEFRTKIRALSRLAFFGAELILVQNNSMIYGYARVSTDGQSVAAQVAALKNHGGSRCSAESRAEPRPTGRSFAACSTITGPSW